MQRKRLYLRSIQLRWQLGRDAALYHRDTTGFENEAAFQGKTTASLAKLCHDAALHCSDTATGFATLRYHLNVSFAEIDSSFAFVHKKIDEKTYFILKLVNPCNLLVIGQCNIQLVTGEKPCTRTYMKYPKDREQRLVVVGAAHIGLGSLLFQFQVSNLII
jgi:hypothetical protein